MARRRRSECSIVTMPYRVVISSAEQLPYGFCNLPIHETDPGARWIVRLAADGKSTEVVDSRHGAVVLRGQPGDLASAAELVDLAHQPRHRDLIGLARDAISEAISAGIQSASVLAAAERLRAAEQSADFGFSGLADIPPHTGKQIVVPIERRHLETGDYSLAGHESNICIERKSLQDAFGTFGADRDRFERELDRMRLIPHCYVVIEATLSAIHDPIAATGGRWRSEANPRSVWATIVAWQHRYPNVHFWFCSDRPTAEHATFCVLDRYWRDLGRERGTEPSESTVDTF